MFLSDFNAFELQKMKNLALFTKLFCMIFKFCEFLGMEFSFRSIAALSHDLYTKGRKSSYEKNLSNPLNSKSRVLNYWKISLKSLLDSNSRWQLRWSAFVKECMTKLQPWHGTTLLNPESHTAQFRVSMVPWSFWTELSFPSLPKLSI